MKNKQSRKSDVIKSARRESPNGQGGSQASPMPDRWRKSYSLATHTHILHRYNVFSLGGIISAILVSFLSLSAHRERRYTYQDSFSPPHKKPFVAICSLIP